MWILVCLLPLVFFLPLLGDWIFLPGSLLSDLSISHYPNLYLIQHSLASGQGIPLWSPAILSGYPLVADPLSGLHYPPGWLALLFPLPLGINLVAALHLCFGALGMYAWLRQEGLSRPAAGLSAVFFGLMPKLLAQYGAGHLTLLYAISWTPWLLWAETRWQKAPGWRDLWRSPGVVLGLIALADPRWAVYAGLLWIACRVRSWVGKRQSMKDLVWSAADLLANGSLSLFLSAALLLPMTQFVALSTRTTLTPAESMDLSLPFSGLLNLFFPTSGGKVEWIFYPGVLVLALVSLGLARLKQSRRTWFWLGAALVSLALALGSHLPGLDLLARLPGFDLLRVPARWLFLTDFSLAVVGGMIADDLLSAAGVRFRSGSLPLVALTSGMLVFTLGAWALTGKWVMELLLPTLLLAVTTAILLIAFRNAWLRNNLATGLLLLAGAGSLATGWFSVRGVTDATVLGQGADVARFLAGKPGIFRVYSPSYSIPQHTAMRFGLQLADGVDPLQLATYSKYMVTASGVPSTGYSVTIPDFATGDYTRDNRSYSPNAKGLGDLNVCYVVAAFDLQADGLVLLQEIDGQRVYQNSYCQPRARVVGVEDRVTPAQILSYAPNRVEVSAEGPGTLVLADVAYPGWQVSLDGGTWQAIDASGLLRSVDLPAGLHQVVFRYHPAVAYIGAGISILTLLVLVGLHWLIRERPR